MDPYSELIVIFKSSSDAILFQRRLGEVVEKKEGGFFKKRIVWRSDGRIVRLWTKEDIKEMFQFIIQDAVGKLKCQAIEAGRDAVRVADLTIDYSKDSSEDVKRSWD